jgi:hypothetical protein
MLPSQSIEMLHGRTLWSSSRNASALGVSPRATTRTTRTHALPHYLGYYNTARPHMGIHGLTPRQKLATL